MLNLTVTLSKRIISSIYFLNLLLPVFTSNALKDAPKPAKGGTPETKDVGANWIIIRMKIPVATWTQGLDLCETLYKRLATLPTEAEATDLITSIKGISVEYTEEYDKKVKEEEFGMDRRYWIGLTDLGQNGTWTWAQTEEGTTLSYDSKWYPGQPDHVNKTEHCVTLWNPAYHNKEMHSFNDENCDRQHYVICDKS